MEIGIFKISEMERERFMRIAKARLKNVYTFDPQRCAMAAVMFRRWMERKERQGIEVK